MIAVIAFGSISSKNVNPIDPQTEVGAMHGPVAMHGPLLIAKAVATKTDSTGEMSVPPAHDQPAPAPEQAKTEIAADSEMMEVTAIPEAVEVAAVPEVVEVAAPKAIPAALPGAPAGAPLVWGAKVSPEFRAEVRAMCGRLSCEADHLMAAMAFESVETFSPAVKNALSGATGLIQFMPDTAQLLGTDLEKLAAMTAEEQLVYVEKYFQPFRGRLSTLEDIYMAILWPRAVGQPNDFVLFEMGSIQFTQNSGLDIDGDGVITKEETASLVTAMLRKGQGPPNAQ